MSEFDRLKAQKDAILAKEEAERADEMIAADREYEELHEACETRIADLQRQAEELKAQVERLTAALTSIAANTCCDRCHEAALVARKALTEPGGRP